MERLLRHLSGYYLARNLKYKHSRYATEQCEKWLRETKGVAEKVLDIMKLFLWELLLANWGVVGNSESDIAIKGILYSVPQSLYLRSHVVGLVIIRDILSKWLYSEKIQPGEGA